MDRAMRERYRQRLHEMRAALDAEEALGRDGQAVVELDQQAVGRLSRMDALQGQAMARAAGARRGARRTRIEAALARIEDGSFGACTDCGEPLPKGRLDLDPTVSLCVSCASG